MKLIFSVAVIIVFKGVKSEIWAAVIDGLQSEVVEKSASEDVSGRIDTYNDYTGWVRVSGNWYYYVNLLKIRCNKMVGNHQYYYSSKGIKFWQI